MPHLLTTIPAIIVGSLIILTIQVHNGNYISFPVNTFLIFNFVVAIGIFLVNAYFDFRVKKRDGITNKNSS